MDRTDYFRRYYASHKDRMRAQHRVNSDRYYASSSVVIQNAKSVPCADCGQSYPCYVMDFHHRDHPSKVKDISKMKTYSRERLLAEIAKCDVVCANCHRERTHRIRPATEVDNGPQS